tara:strand:- start:7092 stop:8360 length:1269 start_codon:yes stop_codon:yes gene_type:complete
MINSENIDKNELLFNSKTFCMAPWIHMHVWPNGRAFPCCLARHNDGMEYGNTNKETLKELWNSDLAKQLRTNMLSGKPSNVCSKCYELEADSDAYTLRKNMNNKFGPAHFDKVLETFPDGSHDNMNFTYMDFRFSNLCNMSCRSCSPTFSTQWYDDYIKKYGVVHPDIAEQKFIQLKNKSGFEEELWPMLDTVEEVYWAGGEPLVTDMHWKIMNHWIAQGRAESINILYTTNFSQLTYKKQNVLDLWEKFKSVKVSASLDASYSRAEYIRKGTVWNDIVRNRELMMEQTPDIEFEICPTMSLMNVWHFPDFHREWVERGLLDPGAVRINNLLDPQYFCMQSLPQKFKEEVTQKWMNHLHYISRHSAYDAGTRFIENATGMLNFLNKQDKSKLLTDTVKEFITWDEVRTENWETAIPELLVIK